jgi:arylsulfatase A-like enzyme
VSSSDTWDELALARVEYLSEIRVRTDRDARSADLPHASGLDYCVALSGSAELLVEGNAAGAGTLEVRSGLVDLETGERELVSGSTRIAAERGRLSARIPLDLSAPATCFLELVWTSPDGSRATLTRLDAVERAPRARPPIVFVSIDTLAARHLSLHGYPRATTPVLEALAEHAVVFEHCVANAPWTLPSYLSVLTGLYPRSHHVALREGADVRLDNFDYWQVAENRWTLAEALRGRGYQTAAFVDTTWLSLQFRANQGFDVYDGKAAMRSFDDPSGGIHLLVEELGGPWLAERPEDLPFFLFLHALDAHGPYWPEPPYRGAFSDELPEDGARAAAGSTNLTYRTIPTWMARTLDDDFEGPVPPDLPLEPIIARYDEAILKVDAYLGKLFERLRALELYDESVIVISADHGESFAHDLFGHVVRGRSSEPRTVFSEGGHVEQYAVQEGGWKLIEVFPARESGEASLLTHPRVPRDWLAENFPELLEEPLSDEKRDELRARPGFQAKLAELRALVSGPYHELYDLTADPGETKDLAAERPDMVQKLLPLLEREQRRALEARAQANPGVIRARLSEAEIQQLEKLGYSGDDESSDDGR